MKEKRPKPKFKVLEEVKAENGNGSRFNAVIRSRMFIVDTGYWVYIVHNVSRGGMWCMLEASMESTGKQFSKEEYEDVYKHELGQSPLKDVVLKQKDLILPKGSLVNYKVKNDRQKR